MTDKTDASRNERLVEWADWADRWAASLREALYLEAEGHVSELLPKARAEELIAGLEAIVAFLHDLREDAPLPDLLNVLMCLEHISDPMRLRRIGHEAAEMIREAVRRLAAIPDDGDSYR
jgi:hypothetical protein